MARKIKVIAPPRRSTLRLRRKPKLGLAVRPHRSVWRWYGLQLRLHPLRTIASGVLGLALVAGLAGTAYWYFGLRGTTPAWRDEPLAAEGTSPPYSQWQNTPDNISGGAAIQVVADVGKKALRFSGPANSFRDDNGLRTQQAELVPRIPSMQPGQEVWVGMDVKLNPDLGQSTDLQSIFQIKTSSGGSPTLDLTANGGSGLELRHNNGPAEGDTIKQPLGALPTEGYSRLVMGMRLTRSPSSSWVEAWRDGQPKLLRTNWDAYNQSGDGESGGLLYANATSASMKFGLYRTPQAWPMEVRLRDIKVGPNFASVQ